MGLQDIGLEVRKESSQEWLEFMLTLYDAEQERIEELKELMK